MQYSASALSGKHLDDRLGNRIGVFVKREVAGVEIAQVAAGTTCFTNSAAAGQIIGSLRPQTISVFGCRSLNRWSIPGRAESSLRGS